MKKRISRSPSSVISCQILTKSRTAAAQKQVNWLSMSIGDKITSERQFGTYFLIFKTQIKTRNGILWYSKIAKIYYLPRFVNFLAMQQCEGNSKFCKWGHTGYIDCLCQFDLWVQDFTSTVWVVLLARVVFISFVYLVQNVILPFFKIILS